MSWCRLPDPGREHGLEGRYAAGRLGRRRRVQPPGHQGQRQFRRGGFQQDQNSGRQGGGRGGAPTGQPQGEVQGGGADFDVNNCSVYGTDVTKPALGPLTSSKITRGRTFRTSETDAKVVVADTSYAKEKKLAVGDTVTVKSVKCKVIGIATPDSGDAAANLYIPLKQAQTLSDSKDKVTTIYVKASDSQQISAVKSTIRKNIPGTTVTTSADLADTVSGSLSTASDLASNVGKWLSTIAVLVAAFLVAGLLTSSAVSRRGREFGTLKALGWKSGRVTRQVVGEALVNGLVGGVLGIALGFCGAYVVTAVSPTVQAEVGSTGGAFGGPGGGPGGGMGGPARQVIQGPTGGGKSTFLQMLGGLDRPTSGSVELDGTDLAGLSETKLTGVRSENIGFVFQSFNLIPTLTAQRHWSPWGSPSGSDICRPNSPAASSWGSPRPLRH